jgi:WD40 repeat protein
MAAALNGAAGPDQPITGAEWLNADPYLWRHLAEHAAGGGALDALVTDVGFLAVAEPARLLPALSTITDPDAQRVAALYGRVAHLLLTADPLERMALLELTAQQEDPELAAKLEPPLTPTWRCLWARWAPSSPYRVLRAGAGVSSVVIGRIDGDPVIVSGDWDGMIRVWNARGGEPRGEEIFARNDPSYERWINSLVLGEVDGNPVIVAGTAAGKVRTWDARTGFSRGTPRTGHQGEVESVAIGDIDGQPVVVSGGRDKVIRVWDARTGERLRIMRGHLDAVESVAIGQIDGRAVIVSAGETIRIWDARTGKRRKSFGGQTTSIALGDVDGQPVIVSSGWGEVIVWNARTQKPQQQLLDVSDDWYRKDVAIAIGKVNGVPVIVSGGETIQVWDARTGKQLGRPYEGHEYGPSSVAIGEVDGASVVVSGGGDKTVRIWDIRDWARAGHVPTDQEPISAAALGEVDGAPMIALGGETITILDALTGEPEVRAPIDKRNPGTVVSLVFGEVDGEPVIVAGTDTGTVRVWDARTLTPRTQPRDAYARGYGAGALAFGQVDGNPVFASGVRGEYILGPRGKVRLWDARTGKGRRPLEGKAEPGSSIAIGEIDATPVIVAGYEDVRIWDARTGKLQKRLGTPTYGIIAVALGDIEGRAAIVWGDSDGLVHVWDARTGRPRGEPLKACGGEDELATVVIGKVDEEPVIVSGGESVVRMWRAADSRLLLDLDLGSQVIDVLPPIQRVFAIRLPRGLVVMRVDVSVA